MKVEWPLPVDPDRLVRIEELKAAMGKSYLLHKSNQVKRLDGKHYGEPAPTKSEAT